MDELEVEGGREVTSPNGEYHSHDEDYNEYHLLEESSDERISRLQIEEHERQTRDKMRQKIEKVMNMDPFTRNRKTIIFKAFLRWSKVLPLKQKCDELAKQLQERLLVITNIRDSYLRDVVSVKYYLDKINEYSGSQKSYSNKNDSAEFITSQLGTEEAKSDIMHKLPDMYDLHAIPSTSLRSLIDKAKSSVNLTSFQLQETLTHAGLLNGTTGKELQPWEQSHSYKRGMKAKRGMSYEFPSHGGVSTQLAAPSRHKLFVRYCTHCIGMMNFIYDWNLGVEEALKKQTDAGIAETSLFQLKNTINKLNIVVSKQESEIVRLTSVNASLEGTSTWMKEWTYSQDTKAREEELLESIRAWKNIAWMTKEDCDVSIREIERRKDIQIEDLHSSELKLRDIITKFNEEIDIERLAAANLMKQNNDINALLLEKDNQIKTAEFLTREKSNRIMELEIELAKSKQSDFNSLKLLKNRELMFEEYKTKADMEINQLNDQILVMTDEYAAKESQVDSMTETINMQIDQLRTCSETIRDLNESIESRDKYLEEEEEKEKIASTKSRISVRVVAVAIKFVVRFAKAIKKKDFYILGSLGRKAELRLALVEKANILESLAISEANARDFEEKLHESKRNIDKILQNNSITEQLLLSVQANQVKLQEQNIGYVSRLKLLERNSANFDRLEIAYQTRIEDLTKQLTRTRIMAQMQRALAFSVADTVTSVRNIIHTMNPEIPTPTNLNPNLDVYSIPKTSPEFLLNESEIMPFNLDINKSSVVEEGSGTEHESNNNLTVETEQVSRPKQLRAKLIQSVNEFVAWIKNERNLETNLKPFKLIQTTISNDSSASVKAYEVIKQLSTKPNSSFIIHSIAEKDIADNYRCDLIKFGYLQSQLVNDIRNLEAMIFELRQSKWKSQEIISQIQSDISKKKIDSQSIILKEKESKWKAAIEKVEDGIVTPTRLTKNMSVIDKMSGSNANNSTGFRRINRNATESRRSNSRKFSHTKDSHNENPTSIVTKEESSTIRNNDQQNKTLDNDCIMDDSNVVGVEERIVSLVWGMPKNKSKKYEEMDEDFYDVEYNEVEDDIEWTELEAQLTEATNRIQSLCNELAESKKQQLGLELKIIEQHTLIEEGLLRETELAKKNESLLFEATQKNKEKKNDLHQIAVLRDAVADSYRTYVADLEKIEAERRDAAAKAEATKISTRREYSTQVSCAVCAIRTPIINNKLVTEEQNYTYDSIISSASGIHVHEGLAEALDGDTIVIAKPRDINKIKKQGSTCHSMRSSGNAILESSIMRQVLRPTSSNTTGYVSSGIQKLKRPSTADATISSGKNCRLHHANFNVDISGIGLQQRLAESISTSYLVRPHTSNGPASVGVTESVTSTSLTKDPQSLFSNDHFSYAYDDVTANINAPPPIFPISINLAENKSSSSKFSFMKKFPTPTRGISSEKVTTRRAAAKTSAFVQSNYNNNRNDTHSQNKCMKESSSLKVSFDEKQNYLHNCLEDD